MGKKTDSQAPTDPVRTPKPRAGRADAQRNLDALLKAALDVFTTSGVDAPVREIAHKAGVGVGTLYRHFPQRADLVAAVFRNEVDACQNAAADLAKTHAPGEALFLWMQRFAGFIATKRGLSAALHSGDPTFEPLPLYFKTRLVPTLQELLDTAADAGEIRNGVDAQELLFAVARLCMASPDDHPGQADRMVALMLDGLRFGAANERP
jgi:AcrR family transcriptional regulator